MINKIADKLASIFGEDTVIYAENQTDGFKEPSFYVHKVLTSTTHELAGYQAKTDSYQIIFFAGDENPNQKMIDVEEQLVANFDYVGNYLAVNRSFTPNATERTLDFQFDLKSRVYSTDDGEKMKRLTVNETRR
ncbi:phage tail terminator family protein [Lactobacillus delbrueckii subsp. bulgaricus]|nr:hypothetical protein [Lactobacillus delbrueckii subsp. bulgaricus]